MMKRQRGRGRKPGGGGGGHQPNRTLESTGPDIKVRGSAAHIYEKYMQLSRDAASSGDRVMSESYMQHAEHYYRLLRAMAPQQMPQFEPRFQDYDFDEEGGGEAEEAGEGGEAVEAEAGGEQPYGQRPQGERRQDNRPPRQFREGGQQQGGQRPEGEPGGDEMSAEGGEGGFRNNRRRRNRNRYRPEGDRGPDGGGDRGPRPEGGGQEGPSEGFGESVPAFLGGD